MRIISGIYKGKKILQPLDKKTRPLKDITKEGIFNILEHSKILNFKIKDSKILDIFSGTGSFGIECLSREAKSVTFVENYSMIEFFLDYLAHYEIFFHMLVVFYLTSSS